MSQSKEKIWSSKLFLAAGAAFIAVLLLWLVFSGGSGAGGGHGHVH